MARRVLEIAYDEETGEVYDALTVKPLAWALSNIEAWAQKVAHSADGARAASNSIAQYCYGLLPDMQRWGRDLPAGGVYFDSTYTGGGSDGSYDRPYTTIHGLTFATSGQVINLKRGSLFLATSEASYSVLVTARGVTFRAYGDETKRLPIVSGAMSLTTFAASGSEYRKTLTLGLSHTFFYVAYADNPFAPLVKGSAVGALNSGEYIVSGGYLYVKDDPGTRAVLVSVCRTVLHGMADDVHVDQVTFLGSSDDQVASHRGSVDTTLTTGLRLRDCATWFAGNNGVKLGHSVNGSKGAIIIRHTDIGARNNGIMGEGDDSPAYIVEPRCHGVSRAAGDTYGYTNDGVTAHGLAGMEAWYVLGGSIYNASEDGTDIIGVNGGHGTLHPQSLIAFNRIDTCGQSGVYAWGEDPHVIGNIITNTKWAPIQIGETTPVAENHGGYVAFNFAREGGITSNACGVNFGWNGTVVENNTIVYSASSTRAALGNINLTTLTLGYVRRNLFVLEKDAAIIQSSSSNANLVKQFNFEDNVYVIPSANVTNPFATGGSSRTYAQWVSDGIERSASSYATLAAAGVGSDYKPATGSPTAKRGACAVSIDPAGRQMQVGVGCYAAA